MGLVGGIGSTIGVYWVQEIALLRSLAPILVVWISTYSMYSLSDQPDSSPRIHTVSALINDVVITVYLVRYLVRSHPSPN